MKSLVIVESSAKAKQSVRSWAKTIVKASVII
jgi:hypothetical protein